MQKFLEDQLKNPQAKSLATDYVPYVAFSIGKDILAREEAVVKAFVKKHKLKLIGNRIIQ